MLEVKVGAFLLLLLIATVVVVVLLGARSQLFKHTATLHARFPEVQGLRPGAPVRLSGVDIGHVADVGFARDRSDNQIHVELQVSHDALSRIGQDAVAHIDTQGLLGDRIIEIAAGAVDSPPLHAGDTIRTVPPTDFNRLIEQTGQVLTSVQHVAEDAATTLHAIADPRMLANLRGSATSIRHLLLAAERGPGLVHSLFYDPRSARHLDRLLVTADVLARRVDHGVARIDAVLDSVDKDGLQVVNNVSRAARQVGDTASDVRRSRVISNLEHATQDLADMTAYMREGKGTLGALVVDPTVYEQLVTVLGGVARSRLLRALVRYAIVRNEGRSTARVVDEPKAKPEPPPQLPARAKRPPDAASRTRLLR
jgi:phospholipid/cholesterol/gamma-HCH transport system substrate-binding protein